MGEAGGVTSVCVCVSVWYTVCVCVCACDILYMCVVYTRGTNICVSACMYGGIHVCACVCQVTCHPVFVFEVPANNSSSKS